MFGSVLTKFYAGTPGANPGVLPEITATQLENFWRLILLVDRANA